MALYGAVAKSDFQIYARTKETRSPNPDFISMLDFCFQLLDLGWVLFKWYFVPIIIENFSKSSLYCSADILADSLAVETHF